MNKYWLYLIRIVFIALIGFEAANLFGVLNFELDYSWFGLIVTALAVWISLEIVNYLHIKKIGKILPGIVVIFPTASILLDALGDILHFYSKYEWYDQLAHFTGGMSTVLVLFYIIRVYIFYKGFKVGKRFVGIYALFGTSFFAAIYEIEEYAETILLNNNRLGDRLDTPNDLLLTILGGGVGALIIMIFLHLRKK
jgi:hypothetical protein